MKKLVFLVVLSLALIVQPSVSYTEDTSSVLLARAIYALARNESYEAKLCVGGVVVNRVDSPLFPNDLEGVLTQQHQFPMGLRYDTDSLKAAHEILTGVRPLPAGVFYLQAKDATQPYAPAGFVKAVGGMNFYSDTGVL